jgi:hypothetical protein
MVIVFFRLQLRLLPPLDLPNLQPVHGLFLRLLLPLMSLLLPAVVVVECRTDQHHQAAVAVVVELSLRLACQ